MAGCLPGYFPVVLAATEAMLDPAFNLIGPSSSLGGAGVLLIVNGPIVGELGINCRNNLFGPGNRANSTIGRAIRLILMNACASIPGIFDRSLLGHPGKFSYCIAENETETHWNPLHVERGFSRDQSAVTVFACGAPWQVWMAASPEIILEGVADVASSLGTLMANSVSVVETTDSLQQGQIALVVAGTNDVWEGWNKSDVRQYLSSRVRRSVSDLKRVKAIPEPVEPEDEERFVQLVSSPDDILVVFAGGPESPLCAVIPSWGPNVASTAVTRAIRSPQQQSRGQANRVTSERSEYVALQTRNLHELVDPTTQPTVAKFIRAPRLRDLRGKRVSLIDDSKTNAKELLEDLADLLKDRYAVSSVVYHRKPSASKPADPEILAALAGESDCVIVAIGD